ncbi:MAG TPA: hypothetical protein V6C89_01560 [Drouetiella sp.]|jgi:hypothetical protein
MSAFDPLFAFLLGARIREVNNRADTSHAVSSDSDSKTTWAVVYSGAVALFAYLTELFIGDVMELSLHSAVPAYVGTLVAVSAFPVFMVVLFLDLGMAGKFEMSSRTTRTLVFETMSGLTTAALLWYAYRSGTFAHTQWGWKVALGLTPAVVFVLSSRVAEFFRRPAVRAELQQYGQVLSMALLLVALDIWSQWVFGRSFLADFANLF